MADTNSRQAEGVRIAIDRGGTFADVYAYIPVNRWPGPSAQLLGNATVIEPSADVPGYQITFKLLSEDPANYDDAPTEGIRRILQVVHNHPIARGGKLDTGAIDSVRMGTTVATNALLERRGAPFGLVVTRGFRDLLEIGDQTRPDLFDLAMRTKAAPLYEPGHVVEADERVTMEGWTLDPTGRGSSVDGLLQAAKDSGEAEQVAVGRSGEVVRIIKPLDEAKLRADLEDMYASGLRALAVCLLHSYTYPEHERRVAEIAAAIGFTQISLSSVLFPQIQAVPRGNSAALDAYLSPVLRKYVENFNSHFEGGRAGKRCDFMQSDGGLVAANKFTGLRAVLSGPAGGVVGTALTAYSQKRARPVVGFDMGGTSTDVSRFSGSFDLTFASVTAGIKVACPQLGIETVAAGGGSKLSYKNGLFVVGPESVGAHPGPACYRKGGELAITDANVVLGRLIPSQFPSIFGPNADEPLDVAASLAKFRALTADINASRPGQKPYTLEEVAAGFVRVANENMARPMRSITEQKGFKTSAHDLCCFGGAGGQHAAAIAAGLGIETVIVPRFSSILSAYGIACADITAESSTPHAAVLAEGDDAVFAVLDERFAALQAETAAKLAEQEVRKEDTTFTATVGCHYDGSDTVLQIPYSRAVRREFVSAHLQETSFSMPRRVVVKSLRVAGVGKSFGLAPADFADELAAARAAPPHPAPAPSSRTDAYWLFGDAGRRVDTPVYNLQALEAGAEIAGPAVIVDNTQTIVVEPNTSALVLKQHVVMTVRPEKPKAPEGDEDLVADPIMMAVFGNRFMSIAEQMGHTLQRTSVSVSIKERLDFSCSIHSTNGALVANAPHIPIHLGSMQYAVEYQHKFWEGKLKPGDALMTNHPETGGTHLPDITVVSPIFDPEDDTKILFYVASRGHHTDIGGTSVTSMNPIAKELWQEGVNVKAFKLVSEGRFEEEAVAELFRKAGDYPGSSMTRRLDHNMTDLQAAISANHRGAKLVSALFDEFGSRVVLFYMAQIQALARETIKDFFRATHARFGGRPLEAVDYMDDGTMLRLKITIDPAEGTAVFDWTGTGPQTHGNFNSPISISYAAIIYALRCMISPEIPIPLNQGVLDPVTNIVPKGCFLNPTGVVAVSGSTIASQRLTDVVLRCFHAAAASQGCANSLGFGTSGKDANGVVVPGFAYGEAIGGGSGAGPSWHGAHAVSVHSTNTKLTDVEVVELRCPLLVEEFSIRRGSGGAGRFRGGDGCVRQVRAREDVNCSIVSQRRVFHPFGLEGGEDGARGRNIWLRVNDDGDEEAISLGNNGLCRLRKGDAVRIETPAGGGWGTP
ncbi:hypothetical protein Q5752_004592 [Cryptotrichosporon argae]